MVYTISVVHYQAWIMFFGLVEEIISGQYRKIMDGRVHHCATVDWSLICMLLLGNNLACQPSV